MASRSPERDLLKFPTGKDLLEFEREHLSAFPNCSAGLKLTPFRRAAKPSSSCFPERRPRPLPELSLGGSRTSRRPAGQGDSPPGSEFRENPLRTSPCCCTLKAHACRRGPADVRLEEGFKVPEIFCYPGEEGPIGSAPQPSCSQLPLSKARGDCGLFSGTVFEDPRLSRSKRGSPIFK